MKISMTPTFLREVFGKDHFNREPEPDLVMDDENQVAAFAQAGRIDGIMSATYLFNTARISQVISGSKNVLDLGCGPATQLAQVAQFNPRTEFIGVDLSERMLENARSYCNNLEISNVSFKKDDISTLETIANNSMDAVISTLALHHLPSQELLEQCFEQIKRVLKPDGALYLVDLSRLKSLYSILYFAYMNKDHQPAIFSLDYERSLRAAFSVAEFRSITSKVFKPNKLNVYSTFKVPVLTIVKTEDRTLPEEIKQNLLKLSNDLPKRYQHDLDDIRLLFKLSGLKNDPFQL